eukprot:jgi/Psemu1/207943/e_gw1.452.47.1
MVTADAIRRANFDGKIPIRLALAQSSLSSATPPHPQHALVSRHTYLHIGLESAVRALHEYAPLALSGHRKIVVREGGDGGEDEDENGKEADNGNDNDKSKNNNNNENNNKNQSDSDAGEGTPPMTMTTTPPYPVCWFEDVATQQPLRWQYFAGVLFDSLHAPSNHRHRQKIPWELRLHFRSYPSDTILELIDPNHGHGEGVLETIKRTYKNSLKQGLVIHHGNAREAVNMSKQSHTVLWEEGIRKNNYEAIRPILFPESSDGAGNQATRANPSLAMIPVRLSLDPTKPMLQKRIEGGSSADSMTLGSLLREWTPQRLFQTDESAQSVADRFIWTVSGISPPLCTPLIDLWKTLRHADNFLYISVTPRNDNVHNSNSNSNSSNNNKTSRAKLRSKTTIVAAKLSSAQQRRRRNT